VVALCLRRRSALLALYIGAYDNNLYALNAETGEFVWKYATRDGIASTPYVHNEQVLVGSADNVLYCVNGRTGRLEWTCYTKGRIWSSPRVEFGHVFFGSDDAHLYAASLDTGRVVWKVEMGAAVRSSVAIGNELLRRFAGLDPLRARRELGLA
jgi:outer membrane protein assembly factor BamB